MRKLHTADEEYVDIYIHENFKGNTGRLKEGLEKLGFKLDSKSKGRIVYFSHWLPEVDDAQCFGRFRKGDKRLPHVHVRVVDEMCNVDDRFELYGDSENILYSLGLWYGE